jgi:hypothetical protein
MASLFTSEIKGIQAMDGQRKLAIPADAAKHDASCASSGTGTRESRFKPKAMQLGFGF